MINFSIVTLDHGTFEISAEGCEIYDKNLIRLYNEKDSVETRTLPRMFRSPEVVRVRATKKCGVAVFPISQVVCVTPLPPRAASGMQPREDSTQIEAEAEGLQPDPKGDAK